MDKDFENHRTNYINCMIQFLYIMRHWKDGEKQIFRTVRAGWSITAYGDYDCQILQPHKTYVELIYENIFELLRNNFNEPIYITKTEDKVMLMRKPRTTRYVEISNKISR